MEKLEFFLLLNKIDILLSYLYRKKQQQQGGIIIHSRPLIFVVVVVINIIGIGAQ